MYKPKDLKAIGRLLDQAKQVAIEFDAITKRPLGITSEVGEYEAAMKMNYTFKEARKVTGYQLSVRAHRKSHGTMSCWFCWTQTMR
jgi:hypothetical protein